MQRHGESEEAAFGWALFEDWEALVDVKSSARRRPVVHGQERAEQEPDRRHARPRRHPSRLVGERKIRSR